MLRCRVIPPIMLYAMKTNTIHIIIGFGKQERFPIRGVSIHSPYPAKPFLSAWIEHEIRLNFALREHI